MPWQPPSAFQRTGYVINTQLVAKLKAPSEFSHYEITVAARRDAKTGELFITQKRAIYERALQVEGTDSRIDLGWHAGFTPDGREAKVIAGLTATQDTRGAA